jgi:hypothetical protein
MQVMWYELESAFACELVSAGAPPPQLHLFAQTTVPPNVPDRLPAYLLAIANLDRGRRAGHMRGPYSKLQI